MWNKLYLYDHEYRLCEINYIHMIMNIGYVK